jgi:hypothetical protein
MGRIASKRIVKTLKDRLEGEEKLNYTFRLNRRLMSSFKTKCEKSKVSMASVLEELLKHFIEN